MALYRCQLCGGEVVKKRDGKYVCLYCNTPQSFDFERQSGAEKSAAEKNMAEIYSRACAALASASVSKDFKTAANLLAQISDYRDAAALRAGCLQKATELEKEEMYTYACSLMQEKNIHFMQQAAQIFDQYPDYKESNSKSSECRSFIEQQQGELSRKNAALQQERAEAAKKNKTVFLIVVVAVLVLILLINAANLR